MSRRNHSAENGEDMAALREQVEALGEAVELLAEEVVGKGGTAGTATNPGTGSGSAPDVDDDLAGYVEGTGAFNRIAEAEAEAEDAGGREGAPVAGHAGSGAPGDPDDDLAGYVTHTGVMDALGED